MTDKSIDYYFSLPYTIEIREEFDDEGKLDGFFARVIELQGCMTYADSFDELQDMIQEAKTLWLQTALEEGIEIPEPSSLEEFSGKFLVRVPRTLHRDLAQIAQRENTSLNQLVVSTLSRAVGQQSVGQS